VAAFKRAELAGLYPDAVEEKTTEGYQFRIGPAVVAEVTWVNSNGEQGKPYDIKVQQGASIAYIEVKASPADGRRSSDSAEEWAFAEKQGPAFVIARAYLAGSANAHGVYLPDVHAAWREGKLGAVPECIRIWPPVSPL
jgi:hypothetical protein